MKRAKYSNLKPLVRMTIYEFFDDDVEAVLKPKLLIAFGNSFGY